MEISPEVHTRLDQISKLPTAARGGILVFVAVMIGAGYFFLMYEDAHGHHEQLQTKELELQRKLSEVRSIAANLAEFEEEIVNLELKLQGVLRQLPNEREIEVLLTDISGLGKKAGIEIKEFRRKDEVSHGFYAEVPIDLELTGEYHHIARFFDLLAGLRRIVNMGSINMSVGSDSMEATVLRAKGTATTFRFVGNEEPV
ncbi:MAG: type 4a pilus biogenesis protein PilO [Myxococcota bacterium]|mgnify:CR=1 FL=1|jgi:type IV pilus assembly protein PilO|nr:type 4a pilus biogenesis protein PilO [bacterium]MDP6074738.1 type 4a pilus biogenesis protein PilO [Myxococcota bacterium]MDP7073168.1 type 4a pilus biogenesis protein PilO [Myxococcota bacterium]MDP7298456.1 type 4a pilus biogenesis protein PilO [Myxococcota bacterium]MDP7432230.1 type 4a pilus biogenesis protein PilO [Myxococcota bacterium]|tara:strand:+ start:337 stop:936 length:600 start_codon:yes stop_codon:yes gene_type:complete